MTNLCPKAAVFCNMNKLTSYAFLVARFAAAIILLQTLYFKFTGAEESVYIFSTLGVEPWGRWLVGALELVAGVLLLIGSAAWLGAGLAVGLMLGALGAHLTVLGVEVHNDGGYLFFLAVAVLAASLVVLWIQRKKVTSLLPF